MSNHTHGPWKIAGVEPSGSTVIEGCGMVVARVAGAVGETSRDAAIVTAAPEMLEALKGIFGHMHLPECPYLNHVREVIAKAEGRA